MDLISLKAKIMDALINAKGRLANMTGQYSVQLMQKQMST